MRKRLRDRGMMVQGRVTSPVRRGSRSIAEQKGLPACAGVGEGGGPFRREGGNRAEGAGK